MLVGMELCIITALPCFFAPSVLWAVGLLIGGYASGCAVAAWGHLLKAFTTKPGRMKSCADVLILSNLMMIGINVVTQNFSPFLGLALSILSLMIGIGVIWLLPSVPEGRSSKVSTDGLHTNVKKPLSLLCLFIFVMTINSGLMYQVINPAFEHLSGLAGWYWAVPYIVALLIMRNSWGKLERSGILYVGMAMIMGAFIGFMLLGRSFVDYLIVDTLMLGACGIFDLFWWSILGEMLEHTDNAARLFGIGLSANVFGVLTGDIVGMAVTFFGFSKAKTTVIALTVVRTTLVMLPLLNRQLVKLLQSHMYLDIYSRMSQSEQTAVAGEAKTLEPLTPREREVLQQVLSGKSNREIAGALFITENTVKTHVRNIFSKYDIKSRAELISILLKHKIG